MSTTSDENRKFFLQALKLLREVHLIISYFEIKKLYAQKFDPSKNWQSVSHCFDQSFTWKKNIFHFHQITSKTTQSTTTSQFIKLSNDRYFITWCKISCAESGMKTIFYVHLHFCIYWNRILVFCGS